MLRGRSPGALLRVALVALVAIALAALALVAAGGSGSGGERSSGGASGARTGTEQEPAPSAAGGAEAEPTAALVRGPGDLGAAARRLSRVRGVRSTTLAGRGTALVTEVRARGGRLVQRARRGFALPLDVAAVEPRAWAAALVSAERAGVARLRRGGVLLSEAGARLRRVGAGAALVLDGGRRLRVAGIVPDEVAQSAELLAHVQEPRISVRPRNVLALLERGASVSERRLERVAGDGERVRARLVFGGAREAAPGPGFTSTPGGPARPAELKARFGEPSVGLPYGDDWVRLDPGFLRRNIATRRVPVLGNVTCHRQLFRPLRAAMSELARRGLGRLVDRGDFAGCHAPRRIQPSGTLSLHAWGLAIDLNAAANPAGGESRQDPRLVRAMERQGFTWGGDFPTVPDPMHFEYRGR